MKTKKEQSKDTNTADSSLNLEKVESGKKGVEDNSPLAIVREKEIELRQFLIKTQTKADKMIADSEKEAEKLKQKISSDGEKKAQEFYEKELAKIEKEAKEITSQAPAKAKVVTEMGQRNLEKAVAQLKDILAPKRS
ncbi:hypothetical protein LCGC14_0992430 [marine sediment metagenome]|uniref:Uncharacterized protein n=1 Tax=marine sediment metagenome TaxID=412755 RepID=A0A0F9QNW7_9ZZZZ